MKSEPSTNRWIGRVRTSVMLLALGCALSDNRLQAIEVKPAVRAGIVATTWSLQKEASAVTLITMHGDPIQVSVQPETLLAGMCVHCNLFMEVPMGQIAKNCSKCPCGSRNAECFGNKVAGKKDWADMLASFPKGTSLFAEYVEPGKPASGLKRLTVDPKTALLPLHNASAPALDTVTAAAKVVGGTSVELGDDGQRLLIHLKSDWTQDREGRLEKLLAQSGISVAFPSPEKSAK